MDVINLSCICKRPKKLPIKVKTQRNNLRNRNCYVSDTNQTTVKIILILHANLLVNVHRSTRTNEYAGMQMFLTTNLKRDWSA